MSMQWSTGREVAVSMCLVCWLLNAELDVPQVKEHGERQEELTPVTKRVGVAIDIALRVHQIVEAIAITFRIEHLADSVQTVQLVEDIKLDEIFIGACDG